MGPRLFGIPARQADTVAIIRRGPSGWCQVSRWDPVAGTFEAGAWLHGTIYPQRCDLSPDGRWLAYFALKPGARWNVGDAYLAISRLPWLTALAAWSTCGTWTRGIHFVTDRGVRGIDDPDVGDPATLYRRFGLAGTLPETFSVERRSGWRESAGTPQRRPHDAWDEQRADDVIMEKPGPEGSNATLRVSGRHAAFRSSAPAWGKPRYRLEREGSTVVLDGVQWADWHRDGSLLLGTAAGALQVRDAPFSDGDVTWSRDLSPSRPQPQPPPLEASRW